MVDAVRSAKLSDLFKVITGHICVTAEDLRRMLKFLDEADREEIMQIASQLDALSRQCCRLVLKYDSELKDVL